MHHLLTADEIQALLGPRQALAQAAGTGNMDALLDIPVHLTIEALRLEMPIRELMNLSDQGLVRLDGALAQKLHIYANGALIALGQLTVADGHPALRITEVLSADQRTQAHAGMSASAPR